MCDSVNWGYVGMLTVAGVALCACLVHLKKSEVGAAEQLLILGGPGRSVCYIITTVQRAQRPCAHPFIHVYPHTPHTQTHVRYVALQPIGVYLLGYTGSV